VTTLTRLQNLRFWAELVWSQHVWRRCNPHFVWILVPPHMLSFRRKERPSGLTRRPNYGGNTSCCSNLRFDPKLGAARRPDGAASIPIGPYGPNRNTVLGGSLLAPWANNSAAKNSPHLWPHWAAMPPPAYCRPEAAQMWRPGRVPASAGTLPPHLWPLRCGHKYCRRRYSLAGLAASEYAATGPLRGDNAFGIVGRWPSAAAGMGGGDLHTMCVGSAAVGAAKSAAT
jgi:hypothetical protein